MAKLNWARVKADNLGHRRGNEYTAKTSGMTFGAPAKANRPYRPKKAKHPQPRKPRSAEQSRQWVLAHTTLGNPPPA